ncbi:hypothetical protein [Sporolactobacillus terrae]|uniref:Uncharacterized protein n=1 Tax=Sporolactobacillus terrae TaxID=269673 RepID=A0A5K7WT19_9BACL|nr:hypothetical protein [Sporolactobacillus terrae]BBN97487.1 hypothetical protein St703_01920 [Sporolactobacillus terrae]
MFEDEIKELGFTDEDIEFVWQHFTCNLELEDWMSIEFVDESEGYEEDGEQFIMLPTGRMINIPQELIHKDVLAQID